jgi:hypothetical protein
MTPPTDPPDGPQPEPESWTAPAGERRTAPRRQGLLVLLDVLTPWGECLRGTVSDCSRTGLRLALPKPIETGVVLWLRARHVPDSAPWARVAVRWAQEGEGGWEYGCQYLGDLAWHAQILID